MTTSKPMKEFLRRLQGHNLCGKSAFAFDAKLEKPLSGSSTKLIEKEFKNLGNQLITPRESAIVFGTGSGISSMKLKEGEKRKFEQIGLQVGTAIIAKGKMIPT